MSEKRFTINSSATELWIYDNNMKIGEFPHFEWVANSVTSLVDLLNQLNDENRKLRKELDYLKSSSVNNQKVVHSNDNDFVKEIDGKLFFKI